MCGPDCSWGNVANHRLISQTFLITQNMSNALELKKNRKQKHFHAELITQVQRVNGIDISKIPHWLHLWYWHMHAFGPPGSWRFTLWILTVSKVLMIPQQFLSSEKKKMHCFIIFPLRDQNKKKSSWFFVLWFLHIKMNDSFCEEMFMLCICPLPLPYPQVNLFRYVYQSSYLHKEIRFLTVHISFGHMTDWLIHRKLFKQLLNSLHLLC